MAQNDTLKDNRGRSVEVQIIGATETHVVCIKASDKMEIKIPLDTLDAESQKKVKRWRIETGRLPRKEMSMIVKSPGGRPKTYLVKFKVPEGRYNSSLDNRNGILLNFDQGGEDSSSGSLFIKVDPIHQKKREVFDKISIEFQQALNRRLAMMTPEQRMKNEGIMKITKFSHGDFDGYILDQSDLGFPGMVQTTNGKFHVYAKLNHLKNATGNALIEYDDVLKILQTLEIERQP